MMKFVVYVLIISQEIYKAYFFCFGKKIGGAWGEGGGREGYVKALQYFVRLVTPSTFKALGARRLLHSCQTINFFGQGRTYATDLGVYTSHAPEAIQRVSISYGSGATHAQSVPKVV